MMQQPRTCTTPTHLTEALRTNMSGGKTVAQLLAEAAARGAVHVAGRAERAASSAATRDLVVLDVRERDAYRRRPHARRAARCRAASSSCGSTRSCRIRRVRILTCCEFGKISTLAAATLRELGFLRAVALDGGMKAWREAGFPVQTGSEP